VSGYFIGHTPRSGRSVGTRRRRGSRGVNVGRPRWIYEGNVGVMEATSKRCNVRCGAHSTCVYKNLVEKRSEREREREREREGGGWNCILRKDLIFDVRNTRAVGSIDQDSLPRELATSNRSLRSYRKTESENHRRLAMRFALLRGGLVDVSLQMIPGAARSPSRA